MGLLRSQVSRNQRVLSLDGRIDGGSVPAVTCTPAADPVCGRRLRRAAPSAGRPRPARRLREASVRRITPGRPRTEPAEERRADLLDAAEGVFVERGIDAARIDEITERAGVAIGTCYLHFSSERDIMLAVQARFADRPVERRVRRGAEPARRRLDRTRGRPTSPCGRRPSTTCRTRSSSPGSVNGSAHCER
ncbi:TetR/AcrR family transcriptional regulator [Streptomyces parvus]|uniref:TetR/AcrR family transcriptional regulator n=1 Tax=Streptomyces parvus TaxID=66428 RepID=UPI003804C676